MTHPRGISRPHAPAQAGIVRVVPGVAIKPKRRTPPLTPELRERAQRVAARIHADLGRLVEDLPEHARGGSGMSRHLGIVRNTTQRISYALQDADPSLETLIRLPGVKGLEQFVEACRGADVPTTHADLAQAAVKDFARLVDECGGSHAKLTERLTATEPSTGGESPDTVEARAQLYAAAANLTGRHSRASVCINIFRPEPSDPDGTLERVSVNGLIDSSVRPGGMPMVISTGDNLRWAKDEHGRTLLDEKPVQGSTPTAILEPFTTRPLPEVTGRGCEGELLQVIDPDRLDGEEVFDVVTASRSVAPTVDPETGKPSLDYVWFLVNCATEMLVFDVYVHVELERQFRPAVDAMLWYPNLTIPGGDRWISRFPGRTRLQLLGRGLEAAATPCWSRHAELTRYAFDRVRWNASDFVGFRCEVPFPVWRAGYCISFEPAGTQETDD